MKKIVAAIWLLLAIFSFAMCKQVGKTNSVSINIEKSNKFSKEEINNALICVKKKFKDFEG